MNYAKLNRGAELALLGDPLDRAGQSGGNDNDMA